MKLLLLLIPLLVFIDISTQDLIPKELCVHPPDILAKYFSCPFGNLPRYYERMFGLILICVTKEHRTTLNEAMAYYACTDKWSQIQIDRCLEGQMSTYPIPTRSQVREAQNVFATCKEELNL